MHPQPPAIRGLSYGRCFRRQVASVLFALLASGVFPAVSLAQADQIASPSRMVRGDDQVEISAKPDRVAFTVVSPRGIGAATLRRQAAEWPKTVLLQLRLRGLESLTIVAGQVTLGVSVSSTESHAVRLYVSETGKQQEKAVGRDSRYWTEIRVLGADGKPASGLPTEGGWFELPLPPALLAGNPDSIAIRWIDFYRN